MLTRLIACLGAMLLVLASAAPVNAMATACCVDCLSIDAMPHRAIDGDDPVPVKHGCGYDMMQDCCRAIASLAGPIAGRSKVMLFSIAYFDTDRRAFSGRDAGPPTPPPRHRARLSSTNF